MTDQTIERVSYLVAEQIVKRNEGNPIVRENPLLETNFHEVCLTLEESGIAEKVYEPTGDPLHDFDLQNRIDNTSPYIVWRIDRNKTLERLNTLSSY